MTRQNRSAAAKRRGRSTPRRPQKDDGRPKWRLVVAKGHLSLELQQPLTFGPIEVESLRVALPKVTFPVALDGGVAAFRHHRGRLDAVELSFAQLPVANWLRRRVTRVADHEVVSTAAVPTPDGWMVGVATDHAALAFDAVISLEREAIAVAALNARSVGFEAPAHVLADWVLQELLGKLAEPRGSELWITEPLTMLMRQLAPSSGMRMPDSRGLSITEVDLSASGLRLRGLRDGEWFRPSPRQASARETAELLDEAEREFRDGRLDQGRRGYLEALTKAPRHPEIVHRLAALDAQDPSRAEAALHALAELGPVVDLGPVAASVLALTGDSEGAARAWQRAADREPFGPLAGLCWIRFAELATDRREADGAFDEAITRAPLVAATRWARLRRSLAAGNLSLALADAEHLEAAATELEARHAIALEVGRLFLKQREPDRAKHFFERALRYAPKDGMTLVALAQALQDVGEGERALSVLQRAARLSGGTEADDEVKLSLAMALCRVADDRPAALAHLKSIKPWSAPSFRGRLLESQHLVALGELGGAGHALALLVEQVETVLPWLLTGDDSSEADIDPSAPWAPLLGGRTYQGRRHARAAIGRLLEEAAAIHQHDLGSPSAARHSLALAIRLLPRHNELRERLTALDAPAHAIQPALPAVDESRVEAGVAAGVGPVAAPLDLGEPFDADGAASPGSSPNDELAVDTLTQKLRASPGDETIAAELAAILERLGRDHELLALLGALCDETEGDAQRQWTDRRVAAVGRMADRAQADGRTEEAALFRSLLPPLP